MRYSLLFCFALLFCTVRAGAQVALDTVRAVVGEEARVDVRWNGAFSSLPSPVAIGGRLKLGNPTVFYPQRFVALPGDTIVDQTLTRLTDSTYTFSLSIRPAAQPRPGRDTLFLLAGEALAGSDSLCTVDLTSFSVGGTLSTSAHGIIISTSIGTPLPYVRFATLDQNYPNPVPAGSATTWAYRIDKASPVLFRIYDMSGREVVHADLGVQPLGIHTFTLADASYLAIGVYAVRLTTNSGEAHQFMHVLR